MKTRLTMGELERIANSIATLDEEGFAWSGWMDLCGDGQCGTKEALMLLSCSGTDEAGLALSLLRHIAYRIDTNAKVGK